MLASIFARAAATQSGVAFSHGHDAAVVRCGAVGSWAARRRSAAAAPIPRRRIRPSGDGRGLSGNGAVVAPPGSRRRAGAARRPRGGAAARPDGDRGRPRPVGAGVPLRRPARDRLDRGRARDRAARAGRGGRRDRRARQRSRRRGRRAHRAAARACRIRSRRRRRRSRLATAEAARAARPRPAIAQPRSLVCRTLAEVADAAAELGYPVVVEAPDRAGERGVALSPDREALAAAAAEALAEARGEYCLVEELVGGPTVTVNAFSVGGRFVPLTVTDREQAPPPAFGVPLAHVWPAELDPPRSPRRSRSPPRPLAPSAIVDGPSTTQVMLRRGRSPLLAKLSRARRRRSRRASCAASRSASTRTRSRSPPLSARSVHAQELAPTRGVGGACVRFLVAPAGELREVRGVERRVRVDGVRGDPRSTGKPGHVFRELRRASDRAGRDPRDRATRGTTRSTPPTRRPSASASSRGAVEAVA